MHDPLDFDREYGAAYEFVPVDPSADAAGFPERYRDRILIDTVHEGQAIPRPFREDAAGRPRVDPELLRRRYIEERDWGADLVARTLAAKLGLGGFYRITVARVLLDFNRFPGSTPNDHRDPLQRLAINPPFAQALPHELKLRLLEEVYDEVSSQVEAVLPGKLIKLAVHTYDEHNRSLTRRPHVSLITQSSHYAAEACMPFGIFDPLYPDALAESTCSRVLRDRISLDLERAGLRVGHNHPYLLPEGSLEVRSQVWYYFSFLRLRFEAAHPETRRDPAFEWVWTMLLNTNLRQARGEALRSYLHRYRRVPADSVAEYRAAQRAYEQLRAFQRETQVTSDYRRSAERPSSLTVEVRKDLVSRFDPTTGLPAAPGPEQLQMAALIARTIAGAIATWLAADREATSQVG